MLMNGIKFMGNEFQESMTEDRGLQSWILGGQQAIKLMLFKTYRYKKRGASTQSTAFWVETR